MEPARSTVSGLIAAGSILKVVNLEPISTDIFKPPSVRDQSGTADGL